MNNLKESIIEIDDGINKLKQSFNDDLYNKVSDKLLELDDLINNNKIPNEIYVELVKFHNERRRIHASLKNNNKRK